MGRAISPKQPESRKRPASKRSTPAKNRTTTKRKRVSQKRQNPQRNILRDGLLIIFEGIGLIALCLIAIFVLLGNFANRFSGTDVLGSLLPFAAVILGFTLFTSAFLSVWKRLRKWLQNISPLFPSLLIVGLTVVIVCFVPQRHFTQAFGYYRTLVGGKEEAGRITLAHQVYAAYRRLGNGGLEKMIQRSQPFAEDIEDAAKSYNIDKDLLKGLAATESSYMPRKSGDGGHGLFQITQVPKHVVKRVNKQFKESDRELSNSRYNAFLGAATLSYYLKEMGDDLFLGLLAYNIGPANGGLRFIMEQYGATDFITIQPYLLELPRDYPIRVLSYSLAFRVHRKEGRILPYEEADNAISIQSLGIPGL